MKNDATKNRAIVALACIVMLLLIALGLYSYGRNRGQAELAQQKATYETQIEQSRQQLAQSQARFNAAQTQNRLLTGRGYLFEASLSMEQRNFGTANDDVRKASQALDQVQAADVGADFGHLDTLRKSLASTNIAIASDLQGQRFHVLDMATQVNRFIQR